ncbi:hypothetical protein [Variovorax ginsengisoli]|uniref:Uncharacterized protein n=1 Tax=Variovorax ginsengisoli TaxID=363844 RepID=A0ABT8S2J5_9BURK|nr:hypothetical protein [Variovorax ginsengisoli]MDN8613987.1 hypothetical protein [Variovorax ginsengisoli]MDO1533157.1 hypothetical protein [Variovorax ginsengisoli]
MSCTLPLTGCRLPKALEALSELDRSSQSDALAANVHQGVPMTAAHANEEGADLINFKCFGSKRDLKTAGSALPHVASPVGSGHRTPPSPTTQVREVARVLQDETYDAAHRAETARATRRATLSPTCSSPLGRHHEMPRLHEHRAARAQYAQRVGQGPGLDDRGRARLTRRSPDPPRGMRKVRQKWFWRGTDALTIEIQQPLQAGGISKRVYRRKVRAKRNGSRLVSATR